MIERTLPLGLLAVLLCSCVISDDPHLRSAGEDPDLEMIRRRRNVRVLQQGVATEMPAAQFSQQVLGGHCAVAAASLGMPCSADDVGETDLGCSATACAAYLASCVANELLDLVETPGTASFWGGEEVPPQSMMTRAALVEESVVWSRSALRGASAALSSDAFNDPLGPCDGKLTDLIGSTDRSVGQLLSGTFVDSYQTTIDAMRLARETMLAVSDAQRSETGDHIAATRRQMTTPLVSRAAYGNFILGGRGINARFDPLCVADEPSPGAEVGLDFLGRAGVNPSVLLDLDVRVDDLVAGSVLEGSVAARIAEESGFDPIGSMSAPEFYAFSGVTREEFVEARSFMGAQVRGFARSQTAALPPQARVGGTLSPFVHYVATSTGPSRLPRAHLNLLLRHEDDVAAMDDRPPGFTSTTDLVPLSAEYAEESVVATIDFALTSAFHLTSGDLPPDTLGPIAMLANAARDDREGRIESCYRDDGATALIRIRLFGDYPKAETILVDGIDGLRCATTGGVEGEECSLSTYSWGDGEHYFTSDTSSGFHEYLEWSRSSVPGERQVYALRLRPGAAVGPGSYVELAGVSFIGGPSTTDWLYCNLTAISLAAEEEVGDASELDPGLPGDPSCAEPAQTCTLLPNHTELPLEDELIGDTEDGYEDSWRYHLTVAREAALHADNLGREIVDNGLRIDERAELAVNELTRLCGVNVSLDGLFDSTLGSVSGPGLDGSPCVSAADCGGGDWVCSGGDCLGTTVGASCTSPSDCGTGYRCAGARCVLDPLEYAIASAANDADRERLRRCLGEDAVVQRATFGNHPVCVWVGDNPNRFCERDGLGEPSQQCPYPARSDGAGGWVCPPPDDLPAAFTVLPVTTTLNLLDTGEFSSGAGGDPPCDALRRLRNPDEYPSVSADELPQLLREIQASGFFTPTNVREVASRIGWEARPGDYSALTWDRRPWAETGDMSTVAPDPSSGAWPCGPQRPEFNCGSDTQSLFCSRVDCRNSNQEGRALFNDRLVRAALAARATTGVGLSNMRMPFFPGVFLNAWQTRFTEVFTEFTSSEWSGAITQSSQNIRYKQDEDVAHDRIVGFYRGFCLATGGASTTFWTGFDFDGTAVPYSSTCLVPPPGSEGWTTQLYFSLNELDLKQAIHETCLPLLAARDGEDRRGRSSPSG